GDAPAAHVVILRAGGVSGNHPTGVMRPGTGATTIRPHRHVPHHLRGPLHRADRAGRRALPDRPPAPAAGGPPEAPRLDAQAAARRGRGPHLSPPPRPPPPHVPEGASKQ